MPREGDQLAVFVVTWSINRAKPNYDEARRRFIERLDQYPNARDSGLESVRFLQSNQTADQISGALRQRMDDNDRIFVSKLNSGEHQGWLDQDVWNWINQRL